MKLILASTSKYRKKLMADAGFEVECIAPSYDEKAISGLTPLETIAAHSRGKALSLADRYPEDIVIGSDQGLVHGKRLLGKPGSFEAARAQLLSLRGEEAFLATGVSVVCKGCVHEEMNIATLRFREDISDEAITSYIRADMPLDCAGSFKIECGGPRLFSAIECTDPTAIQGLPLMVLNRMLVAVAPDIDCIYTKK